MIDYGFALGPLGSGVKVDRVVVANHSGVTARGEVDGPVGVNDGAHDALDLLERSTLELAVDTSNPGGLRVGVDSLDMDVQVKGNLLSKKLHEIVVRAHLHFHAGLLGLGQVKNLGGVSVEVDSGLESRELLVKLVKLVILPLGG